jgi:biotin synthase
MLCSSGSALAQRRRYCIEICFELLKVNVAKDPDIMTQNHIDITGLGKTRAAAAAAEAQDAAARWRVADVAALYELPFNDLIFRAQQVHREHFDANAVQLSTLLSIKTGGCEEDCAYCPQSSHYDTGLEADKLMAVDEVLKAARVAKENGATRFCMGAAWRNPKDRHLEPIKDMIRGVKDMGLETCVTLGMLETHQAQALADAGLDYYNHNLDTSPEFYGQIISTRTYQDRLDTLERVRDAGINVCCGGIVGMGESRRERAGLIAQLANMEPYPESVPINNLVQVHGTPLEGTEPIDPFEFVRTIAVARITMPKAMVRLSAGREQMDEALQALCFMAGANSIFYGDQLLTTSNPQAEADRKLLARLGIRAESAQELPAAEKPAQGGCGHCE